MVHVNPAVPVAADTNAGSDIQPLRTISEGLKRAMDNRRAGKSTKVLIAAGTYPESLSIQADNSVDPSPDLVIEGTEAGKVIVTGGDLWADGWSKPGRPDIFEHAWPYHWGSAPLPAGWESVDHRLAPIVRRQEIAFADDRLLRQVLTRAEMEATQDSFFVEEKADQHEGSMISIHLPPGADVARSRILVGVRPRLLLALGTNNLTLRNLDFVHAANKLDDCAVQIANCHHVLVENCRFSWNNWGGLSSAVSQDVTFRHVTANHNGSAGMGVWRIKGLLVEDCEASNNNWRGQWGGFTDWATGQKFCSVHSGRFVRYKATGNEAPALWFDTDNVDISVEDSWLCDNGTDGLFLEANQGPIAIYRCQINGNKGRGILATQSARIRLENNTIINNGEAQVFIPWQVDEHIERVSDNYETNAHMHLRSDHWTLVGNTIGGTGDFLLFSVGKWSWFLDTFQSDSNHWWQRNRQEAFGLYPTVSTRADTTDLAGWQKWTGQDTHSTFESAPVRGN